VLLEDYPGLPDQIAKAVALGLVETISSPDLLPGDITAATC
jgi:hypothetical protein